MKKCYSKGSKNFYLFLFIASFFTLSLQSSPSLADVIGNEEYAAKSVYMIDSIPAKLSEPALSKISEDICLCLNDVNDSRSATEIEQSMEACFSINLVNHFSTLEAEFGDLLFNGTDVNHSLMEQVGLQLGDWLYRSCPRFTQLFKP
jgi:hypothetical protein